MRFVYQIMAFLYLSIETKNQRQTLLKDTNTLTDNRHVSLFGNQNYRFIGS